jgi:hypothetical protein
MNMSEVKESADIYKDEIYESSLKWLGLLNEELDALVFRTGRGQRARILFQKADEKVSDLGMPRSELIMETHLYTGILQKTYLLSAGHAEALRYSYRLSVQLPEKHRIKNQCERIKDALDWDLCRVQEAAHFYNSAYYKSSFSENEKENLLSASGVSLAIVDCLLCDLEQGRMNKQNEFTWIQALVKCAEFADDMLKNGGVWDDILEIPYLHIARSLEERPKNYKRTAGIDSMLNRLNGHSNAQQEPFYRKFAELKKNDSASYRTGGISEKKADTRSKLETDGLKSPEEVRVFLSSSFLDMHFERDYLQMHVFPKLDLALRLQNRKLYVVDLRGSEQECDEESHQREVFSMCLNEVDACRPRMIGLIGNRYGWTPLDTEDAGNHADIQLLYTAKRIAAEHGMTLNDIAKKSITHMEIEHGLRIMDKDKCYFFFRQFDMDSEVAEKSEGIYKFSKADDGTERLKHELMNVYGTSRIAPPTETGYHLQHYSVAFRDGRVTGLESFGNLVYENIYSSFQNREKEPNKSFFAQLFGFEHKTLPFWYVRIANYLDEKTLNTVPMEQAGQIAGLCMAVKPAVIDIKGPAGIGKSVLLAQVYTLLRNNKDCVVLPFIAGLEPSVDNMDIIFAYWIRMLLYLYNIPDQRTQADRTNAAYFLRLAHGIADGKRIVLLADRADKINKYNLNLTASMSVVHIGVDCALSNDSHTKQSINLSLPENLSEYLTVISKRYGKKLNPDISALVINAVEASGSSPLYMKMVVSYLLRMDSEDFSAFSGDDAHLQWMKSELKRITPQIMSVYNRSIVRIKRHYDSELVDGVIKVVSSAPLGLSDSELESRLIADGTVKLPMKNHKAAKKKLHNDLFNLHSVLGVFLLFDATQKNWAWAHDCVLGEGVLQE